MGLCLFVCVGAAAEEAAPQEGAIAPEKKGAASPQNDAAAPRGVIRLDETVISGNQELPKVLYILPWRDPNGLPDIDLDAHYSELDVFRRLYPPAYRRELTYFESLEKAKSPRATGNSSKE